MKWEDVLELREAVSANAEALAEMAPFYERYKTRLLGERMGRPRFEFTDEQVQLFDVMERLANLSEMFHPRTVLALGSDRGPGLREEAGMTLATLNVYVPGIPEKLQSILRGDHMHHYR